MTFTSPKCDYLRLVLGVVLSENCLGFLINKTIDKASLYLTYLQPWFHNYSFGYNLLLLSRIEAKTTFKEHEVIYCRGGSEEPSFTQLYFMAMCC